MVKNKKLHFENIDFNKYRTRTPIVYYLWITSSVFFLTYLIYNGMVFWACIPYGFLFSAILYIIFVRYPCKVYVEDRKLIFHYNVFWIKNIEVDIKSIISYNYLKGFYDLLPENGKVKETLYKTICYDTIYLKTTNKNTIEVNINTRLGDFKKIRKLLTLISRYNLMSNNRVKRKR